MPKKPRSMLRMPSQAEVGTDLDFDSFSKTDDEEKEYTRSNKTINLSLSQAVKDEISAALKPGQTYSDPLIKSFRYAQSIKPRADLLGAPSFDLPYVGHMLGHVYPEFDVRAEGYLEERILRSFPKGVGKFALAAQKVRTMILETWICRLTTWVHPITSIMERQDPRILFLLSDANAGDNLFKVLSKYSDARFFRITSDSIPDAAKVPTESTIIFVGDSSFFTSSTGPTGCSAPLRRHYAHDYFDAIIVHGGKGAPDPSDWVLPACAALFRRECDAYGYPRLLCWMISGDLMIEECSRRPQSSEVQLLPR